MVYWVSESNVGDGPQRTEQAGHAPPFPPLPQHCDASPTAATGSPSSARIMATNAPKPCRGLGAQTQPVPDTPSSPHHSRGGTAWPTSPSAVLLVQLGRSSSPCPGAKDRGPLPHFFQPPRMSCALAHLGEMEEGRLGALPSPLPGQVWLGA
ncbi:hypothetical protein KIL84_002070 [Mauremys mutica]|uniref:Uncharacterized protein n=1 Tax=Mauremys mutica TaxID=74926 RepID=A0A9D3XJU9_9SAUR|nr:hypothetical protein KIL84_002070 [Mauremys mutica]